jgi:hypothetical protein
MFIPSSKIIPLFLAATLWLDGAESRFSLRNNRFNRVPTIPFAGIQLFFELNDSDEDLGVQLNLGSSEYWRALSIYAPNGREIFEIETSSSLKLQGIADLFFESGEPDLDEGVEETILRRFPEGDYVFVGKSIDGDRLYGTATLTHTIPPGPTRVSPLDGSNVARNNVVVEWSVTPSTDYVIDSFQVIVIKEEQQQFAFDERLPAEARSASIPADFLEYDTEYEVEVLTRETSGNQAISVVFFTVGEEPAV